MPCSALRRGVRFLGRKAHRAAFVELQAMPEQRAQLVLGRHHRDLRAGIVKSLEHGRRAQEARVVHHHFLARLRLVEVVAADAVHRRRAAGRDRQIVRVGEARDHRMRGAHRALRLDLLQRRHQPGLDRLIQIGRLAAVQADRNRRHPRPGIIAAVGFDSDGGHLVHLFSFFEVRRRAWRVRRARRAAEWRR